MTPSNPDDARYTLTELADLAGVTPRTVRYYLAQGLLRAVGIAGPGAKYDDTHLARLRLIRRLQREHQPLADIRRHLDSLDDATVALLTQAPPEPPVDSALEYIRRLTGETHPTRAASAFRETPTSYQSPPDDLVLLRRSMAAPVIPAAATTLPAPAAPPIAGPDATVPEDEPTTTAPQRIERSQWERISLDPDVELHIRRPLPRSTAKRVERLVEIARDLLKEDLP